MPVVAMFGIMLYYSVIIGWCVNYLIYSFSLAWGTDTQTFFFTNFLQLSDSASNLGGIRWPILFATMSIWLACWFICFRDIRHGIEKASLIFMPVLFLLTIVIVGWILKATVRRKNINRCGLGIHKAWTFFIKYTTPAVLIYLLYLSCVNDLSKNYEGYTSGQLLGYGIGWLLFCLAVALILTVYPWKAAKLKRRHRPEEDNLLI